MQLKYNQTIRKNIVTVNLEAINFTKRELEAFNRFGDPMITVDKMYPIESENPSFPVKIERKLRSSFKLRVKFDGTENMTVALEAAESFYDDIRNTIEDVLLDLTDKLEDSMVYEMGCGVDIIRTGDVDMHHPPCNPGYRPPAPPPKPSYSGGTIATNPSHHVSKPKPHVCNCDDEVIWMDGDSVHNI